MYTQSQGKMPRNSAFCSKQQVLQYHFKQLALQSYHAITSA